MWTINGNFIVKLPLEIPKWSWEDNIRHEISGSHGGDCRILRVSSPQRRIFCNVMTNFKEMYREGDWQCVVLSGWFLVTGE
jgi:hypothetical protein